MTLDSDAYGALARRAGTSGLNGGIIYDPAIAACAERATVDPILTFNERDFALVAPAGIQVVVPAEI